jgi:hypothetical protein
MKKIILLSLVLFMVLGGTSCNAQNTKKQDVKAISTGKVEVIYFHFTRRCMTCNAVETEAKKAVEVMYPKLVKAGTITFKSINLDDASSKTAAEKWGAEGQALLIMGSGKRIDLTREGFMYAVNNPEKLKAELKKAIDPLF